MDYFSTDHIEEQLREEYRDKFALTLQEREICRYFFT